MDLDLLEQFRSRVSKRYRETIIHEQKYIPTQFTNLPADGSKSYDRLVASLAEWLTLMELCEDLIHRLMDYNIICIYDFESVVNKLKEKWKVSLD